ncbi:MAG TPA: cytochrome c oxidase assembly protein [Acidimicrobiales bacterium]|nr:cytochrome c oxidase assembly protein [Acidimicrobiales bacterium]
MHLKSPSPPTSFLVTGWQTHWASLLALALELGAVAWYLLMVRRVVAAGARWPLVRSAVFVLGMVVVAYGFEGGLSVYDRDNFTAHVVQLFLLVDVAPPLLAFGAPLRLGAQAPGLLRPVALWCARSRLVAAATHPVVVFAAYMLTLYVYFLTPVYRFSMLHPPFLGYVQVQFLVSGVLMWSVVIGRDALPRHVGFGRRFVMVFAAIPFLAYLGIVLGGLQSPLYPAANTLHDTRTGGDALWALAEVFVVAMLAYLFVEWARDEERRALVSDQRMVSTMAEAQRAPEQLGGEPEQGSPVCTPGAGQS